METGDGIVRDLKFSNIALTTPLGKLNSGLAEKYSAYLDECKKLSGIAGPLILSSLVSMGVSIIDLSMMAWLGTQSLAAGAVVSDYYSVVFYFFAGIIAALSTLIARARGAGDVVAIRQFMHAGLALVLLAGVLGCLIMWNADISLGLVGIDNALLATGLPYAQMMGFTFIVMLLVNLLHYFLSAHGKTRGIFFASLFALPLNALGNYGLMFGHFGFPRLGLAGAGLASLMAASFMVLFLLAIMFRHHYLRDYRLLRTPAVRLKSLSDIMHLGLPIGISNLGEMGVFLLATVIMGRFGADAVAAHVVALRLAGVLYAVPLGYAQAATVRIGFVLGAKQFDRIFPIIKTVLSIAVVMGLLYLSLIALFRSEISLAFLSSANATQEILLQTSMFLLLLAIAQPLDCVGTVGNGVLRGFSDTRSPMIFSTLSFWGVGFFGGLAMAFLFGLKGTGLWLGLAGGSIVFGLFISLRLFGRWRLLGAESVAN